MPILYLCPRCRDVPGQNPYFPSREGLEEHLAVADHELLQALAAAERHAEAQAKAGARDQAKADAREELLKDASVASKGKQWLRCEVCKKDFTGPIPFEAHLNGKPHKKQIELNRKREEEAACASDARYQG